MSQLNNTPQTITVRKGSSANLVLATVYVQEGELLYTTDTKQLYVGDPLNNKLRILTADSSGNFSFGTSSITITGSIGTTGARITKGWFTDLEVTNAIVGSVTGSAATLTTPRTIGGVSFNGSANITVATATGGFTISGGDLALGANNITISGSIGTTGTRLTKGWFSDLEVTNAIVGSITGSAPTLTTARNIGSASFNGSAAITIDSILNLAATGIISRTTTNTLTPRTLTGTSNQVSISNGDGVSGNPTFSIPSSAQLSIAKLTNLTSNGFVITGSADGTLSIDATSYEPALPIGSSSQFITAAKAVGNFNAANGLSITAVAGGIQYGIGTITSGVIWNGNVISGVYGGTGVNNGSNTITLAGNLTTSGAFNITFTAGATTSVTLPASGTLATLAGSEALTNKDMTSGTNTWPTFNQNTTGSAAILTTSRGIGSASFNGSASITLDTIENGLAANGFISRTGANTRSARTLTGTANQISITNTTGASGDPVFSIPSSAQLSIAKITNLTTNGFIRTTSSDGTLTVTALPSSDANGQVIAGDYDIGVLASYSANVVMEGDSLHQQLGGINTYFGTGVIPAITTVNGRSVSPSQGQNVAVAGYTVQDMRNNIYRLQNTFRTEAAINIAVVLAGTNTLTTKTAAETYSEIEAYCNHLKRTGWRVIIVGLLSRGSSNGNGSYDTQVTAVNTYIRGGWTKFADKFVDWTIVGGGTNEFVAGGYSNTTYYSGDQLHQTVAGAQKLATYEVAYINELLTDYATSSFNFVNIARSGNLLQSGVTVLKLDDNINTVVNAMTNSGSVYLNFSRGTAGFGTIFGDGASGVIGRFSAAGGLTVGTTTDAGAGNLLLTGGINSGNGFTTGYHDTFKCTTNEQLHFKGHSNLADGVAIVSANDADSALKGMEFRSSLFSFSGGGGVNIGGTTDPGTAKLIVGASGLAYGTFNVRTGTNENFAISSYFSNSSGVRITVLNDAVNANVPLEIRASYTTFPTGGIYIGGTTDPGAGNLLLTGDIQLHTASAKGGTIFLGSDGTRYLQWYDDGTLIGYNLASAPLFINGVGYFQGTGSPEGAVTAPIGSIYSNKSGGASTTLYVKTSGAGNTGWTAK